MALTKKAHEYHERMFPGYESKLLKTDPEFIELFDTLHLMKLSIMMI